jgi:hypothetical protein
VGRYDEGSRKPHRLEGLSKVVGQEVLEAVLLGPLFTDIVLSLEGSGPVDGGPTAKDRS